MKVVFSTMAWEDYLWWQDHDRKPEPLRHGFSGYWFRRITDEHRVVYAVTDDEVRIAACRYHYGK